MAARRKYSEPLARRICALIAEGESLASIAGRDGMPPRRTVRDWIAQHPDFERRYEIARRHRTDNLVDEAIAIADSVRGTDRNAAVQAARLAVDTRRWLASKLLPERFGDRTEFVGAGGDNLIPPAQADPSRVALVLLNILNRARPPATIIDDGPEDESLLEAAPEPHLTLPEEPDPARHDVTAHSNVRLGDARPPLLGPQWGWDSTGQVRHVSELRGYASGYTKSGSAALRGVK